MEGRIWLINHNGSADLHTPIDPPPLRNSTPGEFAYIRQSERHGIIAFKIEKPRIHFLSVIYPPSLSSHLKDPYYPTIFTFR